MQNNLLFLKQILIENGFSCELTSLNSPPILTVSLPKDSKKRERFLHLHFTPINSGLKQVRWLHFHHHLPITVPSNKNNRRNVQAYLTLFNKEIPFGKFILFRPAKKQTYLEHLKSVQAHSKHLVENAPPPPSIQSFIRYEYILAISATQEMKPSFFVEVVTTCNQLLLMYQEKLDLWGWGKTDFGGKG